MSVCWKNAVQQTVPKPAVGGPSPKAASGIAQQGNLGGGKELVAVGCWEGATLHHLTAALVTPGGNRYHATHAASGGLIVLYL